MSLGLDPLVARAGAARFTLLGEATHGTLVHVDRTTAVVLLERAAGWERVDLPETYPYAV